MASSTRPPTCSIMTRSAMPVSMTAQGVTRRAPDTAVAVVCRSDLARHGQDDPRPGRAARADDRAATGRAVAGRGRAAWRRARAPRCACAGSTRRRPRAPSCAPAAPRPSGSKPPSRWSKCSAASCPRAEPQSVPHPRRCGRHRLPQRPCRTANCRHRGGQGRPTPVAAPSRGRGTGHTACRHCLSAARRRLASLRRDRP